MLEEDVDDIIEEVGCPNGGPAGFCTTVQKLEKSIFADDLDEALELAEELESDADC